MRRETTCAAFLARVIGYFAEYGITRIERLMTDSACAYRWSRRQICAVHGVGQKVRHTALALAERHGRAPQPHPANRVELTANLTVGCT